MSNSTHTRFMFSCHVSVKTWFFFNFLFIIWWLISICFFFCAWLLGRFTLMTSTVVYSLKAQRRMSIKEKMAALGWPVTEPMEKAALGSFSDTKDPPQWASPVSHMSGVSKTAAHRLVGNGINLRSLGLVILTARLLIKIQRNKMDQ